MFSVIILESAGKTAMEVIANHTSDYYICWYGQAFTFPILAPKL